MIIMICQYSLREEWLFLYFAGGRWKTSQMSKVQSEHYLIPTFMAFNLTILR